LWIVVGNCGFWGEISDNWVDSLVDIFDNIGYFEKLDNKSRFYFVDLDNKFIESGGF
jgi:hypothetical protein